MISYFHKSINKFNEKFTEISNDINKIKNFSSILEVSSIENTNMNNNDSYDTINEILLYEETYTINNYKELTCPCCKNKGTLSFHKLYPRNIVFTVGNYLITGTINLVVLECSHCKHFKGRQHFHTLFPNFIFPYHSYSSEIILESIGEKFDEQKIEDIVNKYKISHQLLYYWISIFNKYLLSCSIILKSQILIVLIIRRINENKRTFLELFYQQYFHPFFLNRKTCVPLAITP